MRALAIRDRVVSDVNRAAGRDLLGAGRRRRSWTDGWSHRTSSDGHRIPRFRSPILTGVIVGFVHIRTFWTMSTIRTPSSTAHSFVPKPLMPAAMPCPTRWHTWFGQQPPRPADRPGRDDVRDGGARRSCRRPGGHGARRAAAWLITSCPNLFGHGGRVLIVRGSMRSWNRTGARAAPNAIPCGTFCSPTTVCGSGS